MWGGWVLVAAVALVYAALSGRAGRWSITAPMVAVALGVIVSPSDLGLVSIEVSEPVSTTLFKVTLALLLFVEAASLDPKMIRREAGWTFRLLVPGMLLVIAGGTALALVMFDVTSVWEAAVIGAILAPTDAALGMAVVSNPRVPGRVRRTLLVESGLNDGLALPLALGFTAAALTELGVQTRGDALSFVLEQIVFGVLAGIVLGLAAGAFLRFSIARQWSASQWLRIAPLAGALLAYAGAEAIGGNGFISVWVAGLAYGHVLHASAPHVESFGERLGTALTALSFFLFGATLLAPALLDLTWQLVVYGLLSLAAVRPVAVLLAMWRSKAPLQTSIFLGWFGPRGIASIIIAAIVVKDAGLDQNSLVVMVTAITVGLSVYLHGLTAEPGANAFANWYEHHQSADDERAEADAD
ncbi:MAG: cation:proton antiporter [Acidimicrobiia bacterium]